MAATTRACPDCGTELPVLDAGRRLGARLAERLAAAETLEPRLTPARLAAYAIAAGVFAVAVAFVLGGALLAILTFPNPFAIVLGIVLVGAGIMMRPRFGKEPEEGLVTRADAPTLWRVVDDVAAALETPTVSVIVIDGDFNASWAIVALRRKRALSLGLPLLTALSPRAARRPRRRSLGGDRRRAGAAPERTAGGRRRPVPRDALRVTAGWCENRARA